MNYLSDRPVLVAALLVASITLIFLLFYLVKRFIWKISGIDERVAQALSQRKSSEVRMGRLAELLAPLTTAFPIDIKKKGCSTLFLGQPIDYIHFDPDEGVTFIEVKSGNARLSPSQEQIKAHIEAGNVHWAEVRIEAQAPVAVRSSARK